MGIERILGSFPSCSSVDSSVIVAKYWGAEGKKREQK